MISYIQVCNDDTSTKHGEFRLSLCTKNYISCLIGYAQQEMCLLCILFN